MSEIKKCNICSGAWEDHAMRVAKRDFNALNACRNPLTHQPLNIPQEQRLRELFVDKNGELLNICRRDLMSFAGISKGTVKKLVKLWRYEARRIRGDPFAWALAPPAKRPRTAPNKTSDDTISKIIIFGYSNSSPVPNEEGIRRFEGHVPTMAAAHRLFIEENPLCKMCFNTFDKIFSDYCPHIKQFKHTKAACNTCCAYFAARESFQKWLGSARGEGIDENERTRRENDFNAHQKAQFIKYINII